MNSAPHKESLYGSLCSLYYDIKEKFAPAQEVDFYASFMHPEQATLEAMSGSGRLQIPLLQRGFRVDGLDNSPSMLARCKERCASLNLSPLCYEQSLEEINLPHLYHTAIISMGSFQLIADKTVALAALQQLRAHMHKDGFLFLDIFTPDRQQHNQRSTDIVTVDKHHTLRFWAHYTFHEHEQRAQVLCSYELLKDGTVIQQEYETMHFTWYTDDELAALLAQAGFELIAVHEQSFRSTGPSRIAQARTL
jgi:cyclopropane fatty-acyl-phospholipid synthase-like methyltransferase